MESEAPLARLGRTEGCRTPGGHGSPRVTHVQEVRAGRQSRAVPGSMSSRPWPRPGGGSFRERGEVLGEDLRRTQRGTGTSASPRAARELGVCKSRLKGSQRKPGRKSRASGAEAVAGAGWGRLGARVTHDLLHTAPLTRLEGLRGLSFLGTKGKTDHQLRSSHCMGNRSAGCLCPLIILHLARSGINLSVCHCHSPWHRAAQRPAPGSALFALHSAAACRQLLGPGPQVPTWLPLRASSLCPVGVAGAAGLPRPVSPSSSCFLPVSCRLRG